MKTAASTALHGGIHVAGKDLATLAGVSPQAVSQAARKGVLAPARTPQGAIFMDLRDTWDWLSTHPISPDVPKAEIDRFLGPALCHRDPRRDENGEPLLDPLHPNAIAYMARMGSSFDAWSVWAGDACMDFSAKTRKAASARVLELATAFGDPSLVDSLLALVTVSDKGACTGTVCGRGAFLRMLKRGASKELARQTESELAPVNGKLPVYITAPGESSLTWLSAA